MNVSFENVSKVQGLLTINIEKADYSENVEKALKDYRKKAQMPGFRPGMVPINLIRKMYGAAIKAEEINKLLQEKVFGYIKDNKINMLGEPMPNDEKEAGQSVDADDLTFCFDIALAPEFDASIGAKDSLPYYEIQVSDEMVEGQVKAYTSRNGQYQKVDEYKENDMLKGVIVELENGQEKENGIVKEDAVLLPSYLKDDAQKALFNGVKVGSEVVFNPSTAYNGAAVEVSSLLGKTKDEVEGLTSDFRLKVEEITRFVEGELNQELFDQVFGQGVVSSEKEFRSKVRETLENSYGPDSDYKFLLDARKFFMEKVGKLEYAEDLLKKIMMANAKDDSDRERLEANFQKSLEELTWHLIQEQLVNKNGIKVEQADVEAQAKEATRAQFAQYGMMNVPEDLLENYSKEMLKKRETVDNLVNRAIETKLSAALKEQFKLENKKVSVEEFNKFFEA